MRVHDHQRHGGRRRDRQGPQTTAGQPMYEEGRKLYTEEINAAVRGAKAAGATEIVVMDCHGAGKEWSFNSLVPDLLHPDCEFVVQEDWTEYTGLPRGGVRRRAARRDARDGRQPRGVMNHTVSGADYYNLRFNGTLVGETGIHAALCGTWDCPILLVTGDDAACERGATARRRAHHGGGEEGTRRHVGPADPAGARAGADRGRREEGALGSRRPSRRRAREPVRDPGRVQAHSRGRPAPLRPASSASTTAPSRVDAPTRGGRPGRRSTSRLVVVRGAWVSRGWCPSLGAAAAGCRDRSLPAHGVVDQDDHAGTKVGHDRVAATRPSATRRLRIRHGANSPRAYVASTRRRGSSDGAAQIFRRRWGSVLHSDWSQTAERRGDARGWRSSSQRRAGPMSHDHDGRTPCPAESHVGLLWKRVAVGAEATDGARATRSAADAMGRRSGTPPHGEGPAVGASHAGTRHDRAGRHRLNGTTRGTLSRAA